MASDPRLLPHERTSLVSKTIKLLLIVLALIAATSAMIYNDSNTNHYEEKKVEFQQLAAEFLVDPLIDNADLRDELRLARQERKVLDDVLAAFKATPVKSEVVIEKAVEDYIEVLNRLDGHQHIVERHVSEYSDVWFAYWQALRLANGDKAKIAEIEALKRKVDAHYDRIINADTGFDELDRLEIAGVRMLHHIMYVEKSAIYGNPSKFAFKRVVREMFENVARQNRTPRPVK